MGHGSSLLVSEGIDLTTEDKAMIASQMKVRDDFLTVDYALLLFCTEHV
jgi:hypothetical protein